MFIRSNSFSRVSLLVVISAALLGHAARADDFPSHPIRLIVPYSAGGSADATARVIARQIGKANGQTIVVENRGGSAAIVGTEVVKNADPDGYTLLLGQSGPISINPAVYKDLPYDPIKDFAPVSLTSTYPYIMVVNRSLGVKTLQEFVALAKSKPGALNYGSTGVGASNHLLTELFNLKAGIKMTHIPYRGTALAVADLVAGQVQVVFSDPISALALINSGTLVALAVTSKDRSPVAPSVPTIAESGYPGFDAVGWHGILAPAKTPPAIVAKLNSEIVQALKDPETRSLLESQAIQVVGSSPQEFASYIKQDLALWKDVAEQAKIEVK
ncbi:tripartite tricarboxylate transporter substrate binding protein [Bradyrhizobium sp.]|uniref:Bug family tripartite tricarboxylate transporter substrate binding protein n=1 Tax=Bradyrhizobium sp. TaxID=376 RepID=UPI002D4DECFB|nr:tripartite tricarboxylate transporter substrate binding protein [Bradyrhizobium sp.]HZR72829.1 tripartite tricarboxylate transporter substrate binding protein [Bradyrhizobium sp.]